MTSGGGLEGNCKQCVACENQKTTPIKMPTLAELHVTQIYHLLEKMVAKEICNYNDDITGWKERNA